VIIPHGANAGVRFDSGGGPAGFSLGTWEPEVQETLAAILEAGSTVYDIGAAAGFYTLMAARRVGANGRVIAFEPFPENVRLTRRNLNLNGVDNVDLLETAVGAAVGTSMMVDEADAAVSVHLTVAADEGGIEVDVTTIDHLVAQGRIPPPDLIKMDVEGAEIEVIQGATDTIATHGPTLLVEVHGNWDEFDRAIEKLGYRYEGIEEHDPRSAGRATHVLASRAALDADAPVT
jgi:FkbM family methyltransferase